MQIQSIKNSHCLSIPKVCPLTSPARALVSVPSADLPACCSDSLTCCHNLFLAQQPGGQFIAILLQCFAISQKTPNPDMHFPVTRLWNKFSPTYYQLCLTCTNSVVRIWAGSNGDGLLLCSMKSRLLPQTERPKYLEAHSFTHLVSDAGCRLRSLPGFQPEQFCMAFLCGLVFLTAWWLGS